MVLLTHTWTQETRKTMNSPPTATMFEYTKSTLEHIHPYWCMHDNITMSLASTMHKSALDCMMLNGEFKYNKILCSLCYCSIFQGTSRQIDMCIHTLDNPILTVRKNISAAWQTSRKNSLWVENSLNCCWDNGWDDINCSVHGGITCNSSM